MPSFLCLNGSREDANNAQGCKNKISSLEKSHTPPVTNSLSCLVRASLSGHKQVLNWDRIIRVRRLLGSFRQIQVSGCQPSGLELPSPASPGLELQPISHTRFFKLQPEGSNLGRTGLRISALCPLLSYCLDFLDWLG